MTQMTMKTLPRPARLAAVAAVALLASACGGGDDGPPPTDPTTVPASATASPDAYAQYAAALPANDTGEPLSLDNVTPPTSETTEPLSL